MKKHTVFKSERLRSEYLLRYNPIRSLTPERLSRYLDEFHAGHLRQAALMWDAIERRDDIIPGVASKRKKAAARLEWEILLSEDSAEARKHRAALSFFYNNVETTHALDRNHRGGLSLLIEQMMDAVGKRYAVHEIVWQPLGNGRLAARFIFVPLWYFENRSGQLRYLRSEGDQQGQELADGSWLVTVGDGLMEACSVAYLYKNLPLRDWLIYCERNGMPGVKGTTDALPGSRDWEIAREAVESFGAEFNALMSSGTEIEAIDLTARGNLPYPSLIERMDRVIIALWRGSDLSTISSRGAVGASVQQSETVLLEQHDAAMISETLNTQVDRHVIRYLFGEVEPKAYLKLKTSSSLDEERTLRICRELHQMGFPVSRQYLSERFGIPITGTVEPPAPAEPTHS